MQQALGLEPEHRLTVEAVSPAHSGLGSGTQLALAVAAALRRFYGLPFDVRGDAERLGRGGRSGVGIGLFEQGGVVLDGGRTRESGPAPILARLPFPEDWRIVLVSDPAAAGIHGERELKAFADLPAFPQTLAAHLCHLVILRMLPSLIEHDIRAFGSAVTEVQAVVGDWFSAAQGGRFASPDVARVMDTLAGAGAHGIGQSSWGPTGFTFAESEAEAERLVSRLEAARGAGSVTWQVVRGNNKGAAVVARRVAAVA